jgi:uncharacterized protein
MRRAGWVLIAALLATGAAGTASAYHTTWLPVDAPRPPWPPGKKLDMESADDAPLSVLQTAARRGVVGAMFELAERLEFDWETRPNLTRSAYWYRQAMKGGSVAAMYKLGEMYALGQGVPHNPAEGRRLQQRAYRLVMTGKGRDLPASDFKDIEAQPAASAPPSVRAAIPPHGPDPQLLQEDAGAGNAEAMARLANLYASGDPFWDIVPSEEDAIAWAQKASDAGHVDATLTLANWRLGFPSKKYESGNGPQDLEAAAALYLKAAEAGSTRAMRDLAYMYFGARGVPLDKAAGEQWLRKASDAGDIGAMTDLAMNLLNGGGYNMPANGPEAVSIWRRLAEGEDTGMAAHASNMLSMIYQADHPGLPRNLAEAERWARRAAELWPKAKADRDAQWQEYLTGSNALAAERAKLWASPR